MKFAAMSRLPRKMAQVSHPSVRSQLHNNRDSFWGNLLRSEHVGLNRSENGRSSKGRKEGRKEGRKDQSINPSTCHKSDKCCRVVFICSMKFLRDVKAAFMTDSIFRPQPSRKVAPLDRFDQGGTIRQLRLKSADFSGKAPKRQQAATTAAASFADALQLSRKN